MSKQTVLKPHEDGVASEIRRLTGSEQSGPMPLFACALAFACLLLSRDPAILMHAQFWAEDGWYWLWLERPAGLAVG